MASGFSSEDIKRKLNLLFSIFPNIEQDIVVSVVKTCQFDFQKAGNTLAEMSESGQIPQARSLTTQQRNDNKTIGHVGSSNFPYNDIVGFIKQGYKILILMRGLPGSGKTYLAQELLFLGLGNVNRDEFIFSTDDYFYKTGSYVYNKYELDNAHQWNQKRCFMNMKNGVSPIIIDNTNLQTWEMKVYCVMAVKFGYMIEIAVPLTPWAFNIKILAQRNQHGVDKTRLNEMLERYTRNVTVRDLFEEFKLKYTGEMPQHRRYPIFPPLPPAPQQTPPLNVSAQSNAWQAPQREYSLTEKKKSQLPIEYVHRFEVKRDTSPKKQQISDVDQLLNTNSEAKSSNTSANDLISFINEHKASPKKEESKLSTNPEDLAMRLQENNELMAKLMKFLSQHPTMNAQTSSSAPETITMPTVETKMEVDQPGGSETGTPVQSNSSDGGIERLEKENKMLKDLLSKSQAKYEKEKQELKSPESFFTNIHAKKEDTTEPVTKPPIQTNSSDEGIERLEKENKMLKDMLSKSQATKYEKEKQELKSPESFFTNIHAKKEDTTEPVTNPRSAREKLAFDRFDMLFTSTEESPNSFEFIENIMSPGAESIELLPAKREKSTVPKFDSKAWGLAENALVSWDITSPQYELPILDDKPIPVETFDQSTNTTEDDFKRMRNASDQDGFVAKLTGREIPINASKKTGNVNPRKKTTLDKGCMTDEEELLLKLNCEESEQVKKLKEVFPNVSFEDLLDVYEKCSKDFHWTVDLVSNSPTHLPSAGAAESLKRKNQSKNSEQPQNNILSSFVVNDWNFATPAKPEETAQEVNEEIAKKKQQEEEAKQLKRQEEVLELKKQMEKAVTFGKDHYSEHVWQLKTSKTGAVPRQQSTSPPEAKVEPPEAKVEPPEARVTPPAPTRVEPPELMTVEDDTVYMSDENSDSDSEVDQITENMVELNLGSELVQQLECMFGQLMPGENFKPVVQMPESLARQLHALYLESICRQIENQSDYISSQLKEDEEFAMKLQEEERGSAKGNSMKEIMDEALALSIYQKDVDQWKNVTPDTLALKLTRQKLHAAFPQLDPKLLDEVLVAHDNNYMQTIEAIMNSMGTPPLQASSASGNPLEPPISDSTLNEMKKQDRFVNKVTDDTDGILKSAAAYRDEAQKHMQKRRELLQLAQEQHQKHSYEVAMYYRYLAQVELRKAEVANQHATQHFINENAEKLQKSDTLDLHFLFVKDAIVTLDIFLDYQISNLKSGNKPHEHFFVITGRGKNSERGISKLKPAVMKRLRTRKIQFAAINPGMLRIKVRRNLPMSTDLEKVQAKNQ